MNNPSVVSIDEQWFKSRGEAYLEILGKELYNRLNAKQRGLIYWYSREFRQFCGSELRLLLLIRNGIITIDEIIEAHESRKKQAA